MHLRRMNLKFDGNDVSVEFCDGKALFCVSDFEDILGTVIENIDFHEESVFSKVERVDACLLLNLAQNSRYPKFKELNQWVHDVVLPEVEKPQPQKSLARWEDFRGKLFG